MQTHIQLAKLSTIDFHGNPLTVITDEDGTKLVAIRPICDAIGLAWHAQFERMNRDEVLKSVVRVTRTTARDGKSYEYMCIPLEFLNGWLFGIDANRVKLEIKNTLIEYKRECYSALAAYWMEGEAINPRAYSVNPDDTLTKEEQDTLRGIVKSHVDQQPTDKQGGTAIKMWSKLKSHFGVAYRDIPRSEFTEAVSLLVRATMSEALPDAEAMLLERIQHSRFMLTLGGDGNMMLRQIPQDARVLTDEDISKVIGDPGAMLDRKLLPEIIQAAAKRLR